VKSSTRDKGSPAPLPEHIRRLLQPLADSILRAASNLKEEMVHSKAPEASRRDLEAIDKATRNFLDLAAEVLANPSAKNFQSRSRHDLLTPLGQISGFAELMLEDLPEPWRARAEPVLQQIRQSAQRLRETVETMLAGPQEAAQPDGKETGAEVVAGLSTSHVQPSPLREHGRVLAADDNESNRHILKRWLDRLGHSVQLASDGKEVLEHLAKENFEVVLLDIIMPGMDGVQVLARIREHPEWQHIPVIVISALNEMDAVTRCIELGAEDYLTRPFQPALLQARLGASLEKKRLRDREAVHLRQIEEERGKFDSLLHAILPDAVVAELQRTGTFQPQRHDEVAVLFADIVRFSDYCERHSPEQVVTDLQRLVQAFEAITQRHQVQKIKTIGDAFMAAAGLLKTMPNPVENCVRCGLEMIEAAKKLPPHWDLRVGIHSGSVVAGLLGRRQYLFDLWGATVNAAARIEEQSRTGSVTLSEAAWQRIADFSRAEQLGDMPLKGIGKMELFRFIEFRGK
jgi:class 3 adenylate cyclase